MAGKGNPNWTKGVSGNPAGRRQGAKQKLSEAFLADMLDAWEVAGRVAIEAAISEDPVSFVRIVAGLLPKDIDITFRAAESLTEEQARHMAEELVARSQGRAGSDQRSTTSADPVHAGVQAGLQGGAATSPDR